MLWMPGAGVLLHDAYEDGEAGHGYHIELVWVAAGGVTCIRCLLLMPLMIVLSEGSDSRLRLVLCFGFRRRFVAREIVHPKRCKLNRHTKSPDI